MKHTRANPQNATERIAAAYSSPTTDIDGLLGVRVSPADPDRMIIDPWADTVHGRILDVGSGTGRWTGHLSQLGHDVQGLEPANRLVEVARSHHRSPVFQHGTIEDLTGTGPHYGGLLVWYSTIHIDPTEMPETLAIFRSVLTNDGKLLLSFFTGPRLEAFNHPVAIAYRWPVQEKVRLLAQAGFEIMGHEESSLSPHAYISAIAR